MHDSRAHGTEFLENKRRLFLRFRKFSIEDVVRNESIIIVSIGNGVVVIKSQSSFTEHTSRTKIDLKIESYSITMMFRKKPGQLPSFGCFHRVSTASLSSGSGYSAKPPSAQLKSWESGARTVQNPKLENKYLEHIRDVHDPSQHLKTIEDELKGTIGKALGKQAQKIHMYAKLMDQERQKYEDLLANASDDQHAINECAINHNNWRKDCLHARWELIVHRQAVGFTVGNHKYVQDNFPVGDELPVNEKGSGDSKKSTKKKKTTKQFTDQLDWWSRIGRWK